MFGTFNRLKRMLRNVHKKVIKTIKKDKQLLETLGYTCNTVSTDIELVTFINKQN